MIERLVKKFLKKKEKLTPNCYGYALHQLDPERSDSFRNPNKIWEDFEFIGRLPQECPFDYIPYLRRNIPVIKPSQAELVAFLNFTGYIGHIEVVHVVANRPDVDGKIHHLPGCHKPVETVFLDVLTSRHSDRYEMAVGFVGKREKG